MITVLTPGDVSPTEPAAEAPRLFRAAPAPASRRITTQRKHGANSSFADRVIASRRGLLGAARAARSTRIRWIVVTIQVTAEDRFVQRKVSRIGVISPAPGVASFNGNPAVEPKRRFARVRQAGRVGYIRAIGHQDGGTSGRNA